MKNKSLAISFCILSAIAGVTMCLSVVMKSGVPQVKRQVALSEINTNDWEKFSYGEMPTNWPYSDLKEYIELAEEHHNLARHFVKNKLYKDIWWNKMHTGGTDVIGSKFIQRYYYVFNQEDVIRQFSVDPAKWEELKGTVPQWQFLYNDYNNANSSNRLSSVKMISSRKDVTISFFDIGRKNIIKHCGISLNSTNYSIFWNTNGVMRNKRAKSLEN